VQQLRRQERKEGREAGAAFLQTRTYVQGLGIASIACGAIIQERHCTTGFTVRGEHDYFSGSILLNYAIGTLVFGIALAWIMVASWPVVPWTTLEIALPAIILLFPVVFFPFSTLLRMAADLIMRPVSPEELEWDRTSTVQWSTERSACPHDQATQAHVHDSRRLGVAADTRPSDLGAPPRPQPPPPCPRFHSALSAVSSSACSRPRR
jgi:hypothetical protein